MLKEKRSKSKNSYVTGRLGDDLLGKVRHEEVILIWVCQNDPFEVRTRDMPVPSVAQVLGMHVEGVDYHDVRGLVSNDPHLHTQQKQPNEGVVQRMKVKHSKDVIKSQDDRTPDGAIHKALALWHLGHENRVCHIILG